RDVRADARGPRADDLPRALVDRGAAHPAGDRRSLSGQPRARAPAREAHARPAQEVPRGRARHVGRHRRAEPRGTARCYARAAVTGTLFIVGTPIGNLEDLSPRAARVLREADVVAAEDTRAARVLLAHADALGAPNPGRKLVSYFEGNEAERAGELAAALRG